jgi:type I restriction enzyme, R subunit
MAYYAGKVMRHPGMENPTVLVLTDRNDLDDQLFDETFASAKPGSPLPETPVKAESRAHLKELLAGRRSGGIIFTTLQRFGLSKGPRSQSQFPDAVGPAQHRGDGRRGPSVQLRRDRRLRPQRPRRPARSVVHRVHRHPIGEKDRSTAEIFGEYIDVYDMTHAIEDGVTVKVFYEPRLARVELPEHARDERDAALTVLQPQSMPVHGGV